MIQFKLRKSGSAEDTTRSLQRSLEGTLYIGVPKNMRASPGMFGGTPAKLHELLMILEFGNPANRLPNTAKGSPAPIPATYALTKLLLSKGKSYQERLRAALVEGAASQKHTKTLVAPIGKAIASDVAAAIRGARRKRRSNELRRRTGTLIRNIRHEWVPQGGKSSLSAISAARKLDSRFFV